MILPSNEERALFLDGDRITFDPVAGAQTIVVGAWLLPGLVDVHTHMGSERPAGPLDEGLLRKHAEAHRDEAHRDAGVALARSPGAVGFYPDWI